MSRPIRNARAQELQGCRAGIVSRGVASLIDVGIGVAIYAVVIGAVNFLWDLFFSDNVSIPVPPGWISALGSWVAIVLYLAIGWASTGRTVGKQIMGLRVVRADAAALKPRQAFGRALLCASFYPGLLWSLVDARNRAVEDLVCRSVVVYDWIPESSRPRVIATRVAAQPASSAEMLP